MRTAMFVVQVFNSDGEQFPDLLPGSWFGEVSLFVDQAGGKAFSPINVFTYCKISY